MSRMVRVPVPDQLAREEGSKQFVPQNFSELNAYFLSRREPLSALLLLMVSMAAQVFWGFSLVEMSLMMAVFMSRSLFEWLGHKYVLHAPPVNLFGRRYVNPIARMHALHHKDPCDPKGLFFGIGPVSIPYASIFLVISAMTDIRYGLAVSNGYVLAMLIYQWFHFLAHSDVVPRSRWLKRVVEYHRYHHETDSSLCFCVSAIWADVILRTKPGSHEKHY